MNSMEILSLTATELSEKIKAEKRSRWWKRPKPCWSRSKKAEPVINSYVTVDEEGALAQAEEVQKTDRCRGTNRTAGRCTGSGKGQYVRRGTCLRPAVPKSYIISNRPFPAEAVLNLKKAGTVIVGKTNMDEFAMGSTTETSCLWSRPKIHGIRSMSREDPPADPVRLWQHRSAFMALGSDTGGSIRQPSSFCGVTGIEADLRNCISLRLDRLWFFSGSDRTGCKRRDRLCNHSGSDCVP